MEFLKKLLPLFLLLISTLAWSQDKTLNTAFSKSYELETAKKYTDAISAIQSVYDEKSYEINLRLGYLNSLAGKNKEAINYYQIAVKLKPAATEPLWNLVTPLAAMEQWTEVEKCYQSILKLDPKNSVANYRLGLIYYYRKDYVTAKKYFDVSLNLYPFDYYNLLMSAWNNYFLGNNNEARILFNKVLLYKPNDESAMEGLGLLK